MDEKKPGMPLHQIADVLELRAELLEPGCWLVSGPARSLEELLPQVLHHSVDQLFLVGKVKLIDKVLPLTTDPVPEQIVRVFAGRLEIVSISNPHNTTRITG